MEHWSFIWAFRNLIAELIMPPGFFLVLIFVALFCLKKRLKKIAIVFLSVMIWVGSTNYFALQLTNIANHFMRFPQPLHVNINNEAHSVPQAVIILAGGRRKGALDVPSLYQFQDVSSVTLERLRFGARLAKNTRLPILLTGGAPDFVSQTDLAEAFIMKLVLENEMEITPQWLEVQSNTTRENALFSAKILNQEGIKTIYLVTHFWHMPRAKTVFEKAGLKVVEAPTGFYRQQEFTPLDFYPSSEGFQRTRWIWHEILGQLWYSLGH